jgi:hypothetical protein
MILFLGALFLAGLSVALALRTLAMPRMRAAETVETIGAYGYSGHPADDEGGAGVRGLMDDVANLVGGPRAPPRGGGRRARPPPPHNCAGGV